LMQLESKRSSNEVIEMEKTIFHSRRSKDSLMDHKKDRTEINLEMQQRQARQPLIQLPSHQ
jgi:hypothetical protein